MTNLLGLIGDGVVAVLLLVTIGYCSRLSRRIKLLQDTRSELGGMIAQFDQATGRALATLADLQSVSQRITEGLQLKIEKANFLADDLAFLIEKSSKLAAQLEQQGKALRPEAAQPRPKTPEMSAAAPQPPKPKVAAWQPAGSKSEDLPASIKSAASLEALLARLAAPAGGIAPPPPASAQKSERAQGPRTGAERELLEALKSGR